MYFTFGPLAVRGQGYELFVTVAVILTSATVVVCLMTAFCDPGVVPSRASYNEFDFPN